MAKKQELLLSRANGTDAARYAEQVNRLVRERYSLSEELSLLRRRDSAPEAFAEYSAYVEGCKLEAAEKRRAKA
jgi:hypothetical protein